MAGEDVVERTWRAMSLHWLWRIWRALSLQVSDSFNQPIDFRF